MRLKFTSTIAIALSLILLSCSVSKGIKNKNNDLANYQLKGAVKSVVTKPSEVMLSFNTNGFLLESSQPNYNITYTRDENNRILTIDNNAPEIKYTYDDLNRLVMMGDTIKDDYGCAYFSTYTYNADGLYTENQWMSGLESGSTEYEYDANGNLITENVYEIEGYERKYTKHNDNGDPIEYTTKASDMMTGEEVNTTSTVVYEYDKQGNWIKRTTTTGDKVDVETREITYYQ